MIEICDLAATEEKNTYELAENEMNDSLMTENNEEDEFLRTLNKYLRGLMHFSADAFLYVGEF